MNSNGDAKILNNPQLLSRILLFIRLLLGGVFTFSGVGKLINSEDARYMVELLATEYYQLIEYSEEIVMALTIFELLLALLLFSGWQKLVTFALTDIFLTGFIVVLVYFLINGYNVESCGCFGAFGGSGGIEATLGRDIVLLVVANFGLILTVMIRKQESKLSQDIT
jgi:hypothetical protein